MSYGKITILLTGLLRSPPPIRAAPDFPLFRGKNKTQRNTLFINGSTVSTGYSATVEVLHRTSKWGEVRRLACPLRRFPFAAPPNCGGKVVAPATKGGMHFLARRAVVKVLYKLAPSINLEAPSTTLSGIAAVKLKPLKNLRPEGPSTLKPQRGLPFVDPVGASKKLPDFSGSFLIRIEIPLCPAHGPPAQGR